MRREQRAIYIQCDKVTLEKCYNQTGPRLNTTLNHKSITSNINCTHKHTHTFKSGRYFTFQMVCMQLQLSSQRSLRSLLERTRTHTPARTHPPTRLPPTHTPHTPPHTVLLDKVFKVHVTPRFRYMLTAEAVQQQAEGSVACFKFCFQPFHIVQNYSSSCYTLIVKCHLRRRPTCLQSLMAKSIPIFFMADAKLFDNDGENQPQRTC